jgi:hypothetical protein
MISGRRATRAFACGERPQRGYGEQLLPLEITRLMMARLEMARLEMARLEMQPSVAWVIVSSGSRGSRASDLAA